MESEEEGEKFFGNPDAEADNKAIVYRLSIAQNHSDHHLILEKQWSNTWKAVRLSYQRKDWRSLSAFRDALQPFLDLRGHWKESIILNKFAIEAAQALEDAVNTARYSHDQADILHQQGKYDEAEKLYLASEKDYRAIGKNDIALKSRHMRSLVVRAQGRLIEAAQLCETTIDEAKKLDMDQWLAHPFYVLALLARDQGDTQKAEQKIEESLLRLKNTSEFAMIAQCNYFLGELTLLKGDLTQARILLEESLQLSRQVGIERRIAATQRLLGDLTRAEGHYEEAQKIYDEALKITHDLEDRPESAKLLLSKAKLMIQMKKTQEAAQILRGAISTFKALGSPRHVEEASLLLVKVEEQVHFLGTSPQGEQQ